MQYHCIDIIIFDSSSDDRTKNVVLNYQIDGFDNVIYERYNGVYDGFSLDQKVMEAYRQYNGQYEYLWGCRDGLIIDADIVESEIVPVMKEQVDFIVVNPKWRAEATKGNIEYSNCVDLFREQCLQMTILGSTVVRSATISKVLDVIPLEEGKNYGMWHPIAYFQYIAYHDFRAAYIESNAWYYSPATSSNSFMVSHPMRRWCREWYHIIMNLPKCYDEYKKQTMKINISDFHPFFATDLLKSRAAGEMTWGELKENRQLLPYVCDTPIWVFYTVCLLPRSVAQHLSSKSGGKIGKVVRSIYCIVRGVVPGEAGIEG